MIDFILETVIAKVDPASAKDKSLAVEKLLPLLSQMEDSIRQAHYVERLARLLNIDERDLHDKMKKFKVDERKRSASKGIKAFTSAAPAITSFSPEQYCLALLLQYPELKSGSTGLSPDHFENTENRELFVKWQQGDDLASLRDSLDSTLQEYLESLMSKDLPRILKESETARFEDLNQCINRLHERRLKTLEAEKQELLAIEAETGGTAAQLAKLEEQGLEIDKQLQEIRIKQDHRRQLARSDEQ
jgi:DNA primase